LVALVQRNLAEENADPVVQQQIKSTYGEGGWLSQGNVLKRFFLN